MPEPVVLEGILVRLEPLTLDHVPALAAASAHSRDTYQFTRVPSGIEEAEEYVRDWLSRDNYLPFAIRFKGDIVGSTSFLDIQYWRGSETPSVVEIGATWLAASAQQTSCNTECKLLLLTHAFETWGVHRVSLKTDARNVRSRTAIERLGARYDGTLRAHMPADDGGIRDTAYYSILASEWPAVRFALIERTSSRGESAPQPR